MNDASSVAPTSAASAPLPPEPGRRRRGSARTRRDGDREPERTTRRHARGPRLGERLDASAGERRSSPPSAASARPSRMAGGPSSARQQIDQARRGHAAPPEPSAAAVGSSYGAMGASPSARDRPTAVRASSGARPLRQRSYRTAPGPRSRRASRDRRMRTIHWRPSSSVTRRVQTMRVSGSIASRSSASASVASLAIDPGRTGASSHSGGEPTTPGERPDARSITASAAAARTPRRLTREGPRTGSADVTACGGGASRAGVAAADVQPDASTSTRRSHAASAPRAIAVGHAWAELEERCSDVPG